MFPGRWASRRSSTTFATQRRRARPATPVSSAPAPIATTGPVIIDSLVQRGEFLTSYTPYQAEITQGTLQAIFEFQTMICELTGMEIANASMYDGSTGAAESVTMAVRITHRSGVLVARTVHPEYREVMQTYAQHQGLGRRDARLRRRWAARPGGAGTERHRRDCLRAGPVAELFWGD